MASAPPKSKGRLVLEITLGIAVGVFGGYLLKEQLAPWYVGAGLIFFGGVWVNKKLVLDDVLTNVGDFLERVKDVVLALLGR